MSANKPLRMPEDYKGLKFRIQSSKVLEAQFRALGAIPQVMAFSEVYQALQTGVVDGQENTPSNMFTQKFHEVQKYTALTNHGYIGYVVVVNKKFWDDLPADIRGQLEKAMAEATVYSNEISEKENTESLDDIKKSGKTELITPTAAENVAMRKAMEPLYQEMSARVGKQLIDDVVKATSGVTN
jgi:C4-dicarboxylate-binding protein DctP